jgi:acid phosphatase family membrane protein YuiD
MKEFLRWAEIALFVALAAVFALSAATSLGYDSDFAEAAFFAVLFGYGAYGVYRTVPPKKAEAAE